MKPVKTIPLLGLSIAAPLAPGALAQEADLSQYGPDPKLPAPYRGLLPTMNIANPAAWDDRPPWAARGGDPTRPAPSRGLLPTMTIANPAAGDDRRPRSAQGSAVTAIATGLKIPRQT